MNYIKTDSIAPDMFMAEEEGCTGSGGLTGWICPRCGKVHSPFTAHCDCMPNNTKFWYGSDTEKQDHG